MLTNQSWFSDFLCIVVVSDGVWGRGQTIGEALEKCPGSTPKRYNAYLCHNGTSVDDLGRLCGYPKGRAPILIHTTEKKKKTKS